MVNFIQTDAKDLQFNNLVVLPEYVVKQIWDCFQRTVYT